MAWMKLMALAAVALAVTGCESDSCDEALIDRAGAFVDAHQSCETDADCTVVSDYCGEVPGGYCGQLPMSLEGAESAEWKELERALSGCAPSSCAVCGAALVPTCKEGSCGGR
jgi:hypothetical protein